MAEQWPGSPIVRSGCAIVRVKATPLRTSPLLIGKIVGAEAGESQRPPLADYDSLISLELMPAAWLLGTAGADRRGKLA
jgi:hypothetical protein